MRAKKLLITYDIDLDFKIINAVEFGNRERISITSLRNHIEIHSSRLEEHIHNLVRWNMLKDKKPEKNGKARIISFARDSYSDCMVELMKLKESIDFVNDHLVAK